MNNNKNNWYDDEYDETECGVKGGCGRSGQSLEDSVNAFMISLAIFILLMIIAAIIHFC